MYISNIWLRISRPVVLATIFVAGSFGAQAGDIQKKNLLELYTSQGCSSCPPADKLVPTYEKRADVIPLTLNVDYWDYLGWKDTLAKAEYTKRQRTYARKRGDGQVYTPQMVINGITHAVGSRLHSINNGIEKTSQYLAGQRVGIAMDDHKDHLTIKIQDAPVGLKRRKAIVWVARVERKVDIPIKRGENAGRKITYYNVARDLQAVAMYEGKALKLELPKHRMLGGPNAGCVVFIQLGKGGAIVGAAELKNWAKNT